ncbi:UNVERIFIED_CONTAM: hypothetical protein Scaly_2783700 [Sesamum calycinum]|uniref:Integrase catalytic domain-containing protein n=1 Tax=Sesamum calycinum TaxID=2727403 RepID=A0AAW2IXB3_9LAMI
MPYLEVLDLERPRLVHRDTKSAKAWALMVVRGRYEMSYSLSSIAHFTNHPHASDLSRTYFRGVLVLTPTGSKGSSLRWCEMTPGSIPSRCKLDGEEFLHGLDHGRVGQKGCDDEGVVAQCPRSLISAFPVIEDPCMFFTGDPELGFLIFLSLSVSYLSYGQVSTLFSCVSIIIMESTKFVGLGMLGSFPVCPGSGQQTLAFHGHECLGYGDGQGSLHCIHPLSRWSLIFEQSLRKGVGLNFLGYPRNLQSGRVEILEEKRTKFFEASDHNRGRAVFLKRDKCSCGSMVPSYSVMAGVRQFMGSLSAITPSIKGVPVCSSAGAPITWRSEDNSTGGAFGETMILGYKSEAFGRFKEYRLEVENQTSRKIKTLRSDKGGEYLSGEFVDYLKVNGILSQWTLPGMPQLNGVAERRNRTLLDMINQRISTTERYRFVGLTSQLDNDLNTYGEAMSDINSEKWLVAMKSEMASMGSNQVSGGFTTIGEEQKVSSSNVHLRPQTSFLKLEHVFDEVIEGYDFIKNDHDPFVYKKISGARLCTLCFTSMTYCSLEMTSRC